MSITGYVKLSLHYIADQVAEEVTVSKFTNSIEECHHSSFLYFLHVTDGRDRSQKNYWFLKVAVTIHKLDVPIYHFHFDHTFLTHSYIYFLQIYIFFLFSLQYSINNYIYSSTIFILFFCTFDLTILQCKIYPTRFSLPSLNNDHHFLQNTYLLNFI